MWIQQNLFPDTDAPQEPESIAQPQQTQDSSESATTKMPSGKLLAKLEQISISFLPPCQDIEEAKPLLTRMKIKTLADLIKQTIAILKAAPLHTLTWKELRNALYENMVNDYSEQKKAEKPHLFFPIKQSIIPHHSIKHPSSWTK